MVVGLVVIGDLTDQRQDVLLDEGEEVTFLVCKGCDLKG